MKKCLTFLILICGILIIINMITTQNYITIENLNTYLMCIIVVCISVLNFLKLKKCEKKFISILTTLILVVITFFICCSLIGISNLFHRNAQFYDININNLSPKHEIVLYEFNSFRGKFGCLCIKENEYVYKKIENTDYAVESGSTLSDKNNLILNYNAETKELIMKYKFSPDSEYTEQIARITE